MNHHSSLWITNHLIISSPLHCDVRILGSLGQAGQLREGRTYGAGRKATPHTTQPHMTPHHMDTHHLYHMPGKKSTNRRTDASTNQPGSICLSVCGRLTRRHERPPTLHTRSHHTTPTDEWDGWELARSLEKQRCTSRRHEGRRST
mmetsp:Transcript_17065/g.48497  ORF Transcript_17065/g.48497 Transcript_17065/m.48497 type:complete len:146 (-) Transcript_17065:702-1139(-)